MANPVPAVFMGQPGAGGINLGDLLRAYQDALAGKLLPGGGAGGATTLAYPSDSSAGPQPGGVATMMAPHD